MKGQILARFHDGRTERYVFPVHTDIGDVLGDRPVGPGLVQEDDRLVGGGLDGLGEDLEEGHRQRGHQVSRQDYGPALEGGRR